MSETSENGRALSVPQPAALGTNGTYTVFRKYVSRVGAFNDFTKAHGD